MTRTETLSYPTALRSILLLTIQHLNLFQHSIDSILTLMAFKINSWLTGTLLLSTSKTTQISLDMTQSMNRLLLIIFQIQLLCCSQESLTEKDCSHYIAEAMIFTKNMTSLKSCSGSQHNSLTQLELDQGLYGIWASQRLQEVLRMFITKY